MSRFQNRIQEVTAEKKQIEQEVSTGFVELSKNEEAIQQNILDDVSNKYASLIAQQGLTDNIQNMIKDDIKQRAESLGLDYETQKKIEKAAISQTGLGPLEPLLENKNVTEIVVQDKDHIYVEINGKVVRVNTKFNSEEHLETVINKIVAEVGKSINIMHPLVDARLLDGSRVNATFPPVSPDGATLTIRRFPEKPLMAEDYLRFGSIDKRGLLFLEQCVKGKVNIFISGGTGTGKTTFLNMMSNYIPKDELILTIEDTCELKIQSERVRRLETRVSDNVDTGNGVKMENVDTSRCVKNALRMRPDRIIVGEVRGGEIVDLLSALSTGHEGSMATGHANSPQNMCNVRLPILYGMNKDTDIKEASQFLQFAEAIQLIVQLRRFEDGKRRIVQISAIEGVDKNNGGRINIKDIYRYDEKNDRFYATGYVPKTIIKKCAMYGVDIDESIFPNESGDLHNLDVATNAVINSLKLD